MMFTMGPRRLWMRLQEIEFVSQFEIFAQLRVLFLIIIIISTEKILQKKWEILKRILILIPI